MSSEDAQKWQQLRKFVGTRREVLQQHRSGRKPLDQQPIHRRSPPSMALARGVAAATGRSSSLGSAIIHPILTHSLHRKKP
ncbi:unnamed protein product [Victoria cruziana]